MSDRAGLLRVNRSCAIPLDELEWSFTAAGGPGGQHANTANTKAEVRFDVSASPSLGPRQRARLIEALGPVVRVRASERRSQLQNRELALERLRAKLATALSVQPPRVATTPTRTARKERVERKRRRGELKLTRRPPRPED